MKRTMALGLAVSLSGLATGGMAYGLPGLPGLGQLELSAKERKADPQSYEFVVKQNANRPVYLSCREDGLLGERHLMRGTPDGEQTFVLRGLKADTSYTCVARWKAAPLRGSNQVSFHTKPLPDDLVVPKVNRPTRELQRVGYVLYNSGNMYYEGEMSEDFDPSLLRTDSNYLVILDAQGNVRWYKEGPGGGDIEAKYLGDNRILLGGQSMPGIYPPQVVNLDKRVELIATQERTFTHEYASRYGLFYNHEAHLSERNTVFTLVHTLSPIDQATLGFVVKEFPLADPDGNGIMDEPIWTWDSLNAARDGKIDHTSERFPTDPLHANSVYTGYDESGRFSVYVSMRNNSHIIKIDYQTGEIMWTMGFDTDDFTLLNKDGTPARPQKWFFNQHDVQYHNGILTMNDNGSDRFLAKGFPHSRMLKLEINEAARTLRILDEYIEPGWMEPFWGGYDILENGDQLMAVGHCGFCGFPTKRLSRVFMADDKGNVFWRAEVPEETGANTMFYRAARIDGCAIFNNTTYCPSLANFLLEPGN